MYLNESTFPGGGLIMSYCGLIGQNFNLFSYGYDGHEPKCLKIKSLLSQQLKLLSDSGITDFIIGCSTAVEIWAAEEIIRMMRDDNKSKLHCIESNDNQKLFFSKQLFDKYNTILRQCTDSITIEAPDTEQYKERTNRYLVNHSDVLVIVYDSYRGGHSAMAHTVEYANTRKCQIVHLHPEPMPASPLGLPPTG